MVYPSNGFVLIWNIDGNMNEFLLLKVDGGVLFFFRQRHDAMMHGYESCRNPMLTIIHLTN